MRERAESIGAPFRIWSKRGAGTEVKICVSADISTDRSCRHYEAMTEYEMYRNDPSDMRAEL
jgi:hypothetical protein